MYHHDESIYPMLFTTVAFILIYAFAYGVVLITTIPLCPKHGLKNVATHRFFDILENLFLLLTTLFGQLHCVVEMNPRTCSLIVVLDRRSKDKKMKIRSNHIHRAIITFF